MHLQDHGKVKISIFSWGHAPGALKGLELKKFDGEVHVTIEPSSTGGTYLYLYWYFMLTSSES